MVPVDRQDLGEWFRVRGPKKGRHGQTKSPWVPS